MVAKFEEGISMSRGDKQEAVFGVIVPHQRGRSLSRPTDGGSHAALPTEVLRLARDAKVVLYFRNARDDDLTTDPEVVLGAWDEDAPVRIEHAEDGALGQPRPLKPFGKPAQLKGGYKHADDLVPRVAQRLGEVDRPMARGHALGIVTEREPSARKRPPVVRTVGVRVGARLASDADADHAAVRLRPRDEDDARDVFAVLREVPV